MKHYTLKNYSIDESVGALLKQASNVIERRLSAGIKRKCPGATLPQWLILMLVGNNKCKTSAELSGAIGCDTASITRTLDRLESKGLITRTRSSLDRRRIDLSLTAEGKKLLPRLPEVSVEMMNEVLRDFTREEVGRLKDYLRRIVAAGA